MYFFYCYAVNHIARGKASGADNILIAKLFSARLQRGKVPQRWKEANMIILHKKKEIKRTQNTIDPSVCSPTSINSLVK